MMSHLRLITFFITESLRSLTLECSIIDKDLYSDHVLLYLKFHIAVIHVPEQKQPYTVKQAWHKASEQDVNLYKDRPDDLLSKIQVDDEMFHCRDINCAHHYYYNYLLNTKFAINYWKKNYYNFCNFYCCFLTKMYHYFCYFIVIMINLNSYM